MIVRAFACIKGFTMTEMVIVTLIFSLFMLAVYATLDVGMKTWQMGEVKSDLYQKGQIVMNYIIKDFSLTTWMSAQIDNNGDPSANNEYICFETPINPSDGSIQNDNNTGGVLWQGYILYYIYPRWQTNNSPDVQRNLYRHFKPRTTPEAKPLALTDIFSNIDIDTAPSGDAIRTVARDIYSISFSQEGQKLGITICFKKNFRQEGMVMFDSNKGTEVFKLKGSVIPKN